MSRNFELLRRAELGTNPSEMLTPAATVLPPSRPTLQPRREQAAEWAAALSILRKHWRISALFSGVVLATVAIAVFTMKAVYEPVARLEVDPPGETFSLESASSNYDDAEYLETQSQNLKGDKLAIGVIRKLHLDQNPEIVPDAETRARKDASGDAQDVVRLTPAENAALGAFRSHLSVTRDTSSRVITVSFASHDPVLAAQITNAVVHTYIDQTFEEQHDAIMRSTEWLSRQLDDIRTRMEESNRVLADFQKSIGVADVDENKSTFTEQLAQLNQQLTQAQADRIQLEALLRSVKSGNPDSLPEFRNNPVVQQLSEKLAEQRAQLAQDSVIYGKNHPVVKKLQSQVEELQAQLDAQKTAVLAAVRTNYTAAKSREELMNSELKGTTDQINKMAKYNALKHEAQANSDLYNSLFARVKEAGIAAASKSSNIRVVDEARVLMFPTRPNRMLDLGIGLLVALIGGVAVAFVREQIDTRLFTPEDMRAWIGTSNISILPLFFADGNHQLTAAGGNGRGLEKLAPGIRFLLDHPYSPEAEALRSLYTSIMLSQPGAPPQVVLVVSSFPGEGKTTVALNLAIAMSQHGNTCLVDADLRRGRIATAFGISAKVGLTEILEASATIEDTLVSVPRLDNLSIVPAHAGSANAGQLVCSEAMRQTIAALRQRFQYVVIDSAPLLPFADGRALSAAVDGLIFVGRSGVTTRQVVQRSLELLEEVHAAPVLEFVLNAADLASAEYRYYQYGSNYYKPTSKTASN